MTERPILFSGQMVRALLAGWKTQTRRVVKPQPKEPFHSASGAWVDMDQEGGTITEIRCPYGKPGDLLWVRETWQVPALCGIQYRATDTERIGHWDPSVGPWKPSIFMPKWACRLTLKIADVRIELLNDISANDAEAEGWPHRDTGGRDVPLRDAYPIGWYANLWDDINGRGSWDENPWVWVLTFERVTSNSRPDETESPL